MKRYVVLRRALNFFYLLAYVNNEVEHFNTATISSHDIYLQLFKNKDPE